VGAWASQAGPHIAQASSGEIAGNLNGLPGYLFLTPVPSTITRSNARQKPLVPTPTPPGTGEAFRVGGEDRSTPPALGGAGITTTRLCPRAPAKKHPTTPAPPGTGEASRCGGRGRSASPALGNAGIVLRENFSLRGFSPVGRASLSLNLRRTFGSSTLGLSPGRRLKPITKPGNCCTATTIPPIYQPMS
jgi:hypothetical protein